MTTQVFFLFQRIKKKVSHLGSLKPNVWVWDIVHEEAFIKLLGIEGDIA